MLSSVFMVNEKVWLSKLIGNNTDKGASRILQLMAIKWSVQINMCRFVVIKRWPNFFCYFNGTLQLLRMKVIRIVWRDSLRLWCEVSVERFFEVLGYSACLGAHEKRTSCVHFGWTISRWNRQTYLVILLDNFSNWHHLDTLAPRILQLYLTICMDILFWKRKISRHIDSPLK